MRAARRQAAGAFASTLLDIAKGKLVDLAIDRVLGSPDMPRKSKGKGRRQSDAVANRVEPGASRPGVGPRIPRTRAHIERPFGVAQSYRVPLCRAFTSNFTLSSSYQEYNVAINDAYNGGTSSAGYSKLMAFYSKCVVIGARITVKLAGTGNVQPWASGVVITTNTTSLGSLTAAIDNGFCEWKVLSASPDCVSFSIGTDIRKFANVPDLLANYNWFSGAASSPTQLCVAHIFVQALNGTPSNIVSMVFEIEQECVFTDPIPFT